MSTLREYRRGDIKLKEIIKFLYWVFVRVLGVWLCLGFVWVFFLLGVG